MLATSTKNRSFRYRERYDLLDRSDDYTSRLFRPATSKKIQLPLAMLLRHSESCRVSRAAYIYICARSLPAWAGGTCVNNSDDIYLHRLRR
jgi:hypothetical protein